MRRIERGHLHLIDDSCARVRGSRRRRSSRGIIPPLIWACISRSPPNGTATNGVRCWGGTAVPSLVDERGYLWQTVAQVYAHARLDEAEAELRAQIDKALAAGIDATHLDSHMGTLQLRADYHEIYCAARAATIACRSGWHPRRCMRTDGMRRDSRSARSRPASSRPTISLFIGPRARSTRPNLTGPSLIRTLKPGVTGDFVPSGDRARRS